MSDWSYTIYICVCECVCGQFKSLDEIVFVLFHAYPFCKGMDLFS